MLPSRPFKFMSAGAPKSMQSTTVNSTAITACCPFCGLLCDDVKLTQRGQKLTLTNTDCRLARQGFEQPLQGTAPSIRGAAASYDEALKAAAALMAQSRRPFFGGLGTDVDGMRAVLEMADRKGGVVDHMNGVGISRMNAMLATRGWIATTLAEVRNRADYLLVIGADAITENPRFIERCVRVKHSLHPDRAAARKVVLLAPRTNTRAVKALDPELRHLPLQMDRTAEVIQTLRALLKGKAITSKLVGGIKLADLMAVATELRQAKYAVIAWGPQTLGSEQGPVVIELLGELIRDLNMTTRAAGIALAGAEGGMSANSTCGWQTGYPLRTSFSGGHPEHDPLRNALGYALQHRTVDLLCWISTFSVQRGPPASEIPTIVLGRPGLTLAQEPEVFIPVGTPGLDHGGRMVRMDSVVSLPLRRIREVDLPSLSQVLRDVTALQAGT
jgi:formylmethanofuran dehydrogenase subunit B